MNVIALGDAESRFVGLQQEKERILIFIPASLRATGQGVF
jgi:hypothetical protein